MPRRRVTSKDVAKKAGVSRTTVSFVLNGVAEANISEETRERVLAAAAELGYVPDAAAQALATGRAQTLGLIFTREEPNPGGDLMRYQLVEGLLEFTRQAGMALLIDSVPPAEVADTYRNLARTKRIDGLVISDTRRDDHALRDLAREGFPIVVLGRFSDGVASSIDFDNRGGARLAVEHLIAQGHTRIGMINYAPLALAGATERLLGYQDALAGAGLPYDDALMHCANFSAESGYVTAQRFLKMAERPTALFVASDEVAFGALAAIHDVQLSIPDDMAVVGFDDAPLARFATPPLTTVRLPFGELGRLGGKIVTEHVLGGSGTPRHVLLDGELIVRASSVRQR